MISMLVLTTAKSLLHLLDNRNKIEYILTNCPLVKLVQWILGRQNRFRAVFSILRQGLEAILRTIVYIDGFNLYFGSLKNTPHKWLDVYALSHLLCKEQTPDSELVAVKYFTADIKAKLSRRGIDACKAQQDYLLALKSHAPDIEIIKGKYLITKGMYHPYGDPVDFDNKHEVWKAEEKHTDVNIALHILCDVIDKSCEQIILFSNDSDIAPALKISKERNPNIKIGIVTPVLQGNRNPSADLKEHADWLRQGIHPEEL